MIHQTSTKTTTAIVIPAGSRPAGSRPAGSGTAAAR
jgi:hypothetical protein